MDFRSANTNDSGLLLSIFLFSAHLFQAFLLWDIASEPVDRVRGVDYHAVRAQYLHNLGYGAWVADESD